MIIKKTKIKEIFDNISKEKGFIDFEEFHNLLDDILNMSKTDNVYITREMYQEKANKIMDRFDDKDKSTFMKIMILAYVDMKLFTKES